jgi:hypothetical protein
MAARSRRGRAAAGSGLKPTADRFRQRYTNVVVETNELTAAFPISAPKAVCSEYAKSQTFGLNAAALESFGDGQIPFGIFVANMTGVRLSFRKSWAEAVRLFAAIQNRSKPQFWVSFGSHTEMVRVVGIEPTLLAEQDFESCASTSFTTPARGPYNQAISFRQSQFLTFLRRSSSERGGS